MHSTTMKISSFLFLPLCLIVLTLLIKEKPIDLEEKKIQKTEFQTILDAANLSGSILVYDLNLETYYSNDFKWAERQFIPASTFKIPNSLIALELGIVENEETIMPWDGQERSITSWNQDLTFKQAFHYSCVPCYQDIARQVGAERMASMLQKFDFGRTYVSEENIDLFWLEGITRISQMQQIDFLRRFEASDLGISDRTDMIAKDMMVIQQGPEFEMIGKTGLSLSGVGWFVGYIKKETNVYFFSTNVQMGGNTDFNLRQEVTFKALEQLKIYETKP